MAVLSMINMIKYMALFMLHTVHESKLLPFTFNYFICLFLMIYVLYTSH